MATLLCVTCLRDWWALQRQILSFSKYLPNGQRIIYVIEDVDPLPWFTQWASSNCENLLKDHSVQIITGQLYLSKWRDNNSISHNGWLRQQLLKLLIVKEQKERCVVVDSKDFLIAILDVSDLGGHSQIMTKESLKNHKFNWIFEVYEKNVPMFNQGTVSDCSTPYIMDPIVIQRGLNMWKGGNIVKFWSDYTHHSEFWLYHLWHVKLGQRTIPYKQTMFHIWPGQEYDMPLFDKLKHLADIGFNWFGIHREVYKNMSDDDIRCWLAWLESHGLSGEFNLKEIAQFRADQ